MIPPTPHRGRVGVLVLVLGLFGGVRVPFAQAQEDEGVDRAREHFERALRLAEESRWSEAVRELEVAREIRATPPVYYNLGVALQHVGRTRHAIAAFEEFLRAARPDADPALVQGATAAAEALRAQVARIDVRVTPPSARVTVDGAPAAGLVELDAGPHVVVAEAPGFRRTVRSIELAPGAHESLAVVLPAVVPPAAVPPGRLRVSANVSGAQIRVDGRLVGRGHADRALALGPHVVQVSAPGYTSARRRLWLAEGEPTDLRVRLEEADGGLLSRPIVWVGIGAVVVGAIVAGVAVALAPGEPLYQGELGHVSNALSRSN